ncbi:MAG TPA: Rid family hydrolase [Acidimicrobiia bacterium]|nr:Rid family hydrolase [Acidimicrobiia bacterium]
MSPLLQPVHLVGRGDYDMPYTPAVKIVAGRPVYLAGVTAAPVYHSHPHVAAEFDAIPTDPGEQAEVAMDNLEAVLAAAGSDLAHLVEVTRFIVDIDRNQDAVNRVMGRRLGAHRPATTTVEVSRLATDGRLVLELRAVAVAPE